MWRNLGKCGIQLWSDDHAEREGETEKRRKGEKEKWHIGRSPSRSMIVKGPDPVWSISSVSSHADGETLQRCTSGDLRHSIITEIKKSSAILGLTYETHALTKRSQIDRTEWQ